MRTRSSVRSPSAAARSSRDGRRRLRLAARPAAARWRGGLARAAAAGSRLPRRPLHHAAGVAAAADLREIDFVLLRGLARRRRRARPASLSSAASARLRCGRRRLPRLGARRGAALAASSSMTPSTSPTFTSAPSCAIDAAQHAGLRRRDLEVDLVGLELDERVADGDGVPFLLQPLRDARVDDRFADFGDDDVRWHHRCRLDLTA